MNLGDYENALDTYLSFIGKAKEDVKDVDIWLYSECGWLCNEVGDYEQGLKYLLEAEKAFKKAFGLSGDGLNLYNRGIALRLLGKYEEAVEVLLQSRKISVQEGDVTDGEDLDLARCYVALKDKKNAEKYLDLAREGLENVPEEHADEFEATLEEIEDLIEKL